MAGSPGARGGAPPPCAAPAGDGRSGARRGRRAPAIALARDGYVLSRADADILDGKRFAKDPVAATIFLRPDGSRFEAGDRLVQTELAATLEEIAQRGPDAFYKGPIPMAVERASSEN